MLNRSGYPNYAEYVEEYIGKTSGSGFVYIAENGGNYVITNRHVVSKCEGASVEFQDADGASKTYKNLKVIATDENLDIAILEFENGARPFKTGLPLSREAVVDGEDVWTAGFPGLNGEPVWQFGKGNVTNASVKIKEFLDPEISTLIQHSAPVDSGNSGGPLLRAKGGAYEVVGMNTWKFFYRQAANISIPAAAIQNFINSATKAKSESKDANGILLRAEAMKKLFDEEEIYFRDLSKYISFDYIKENGAKSFIKNMKTASSNDRNSIRGAFISYSPIEGLAYSVSLDVYKIFREGDFMKNAQIAEPEKDGEDYIVNFKTDSKSVQTKWTYETLGISGFWRMSSCETLSEQKSSKSKKETPVKDLEKSDSKKSKDSKNEKSGAKVEIERPYKLALKVGMFPNIDKDAKNFGFAGGLIYMPFKIVGIYINGGKQEIADKGCFYFSAGVDVEVPVMINNFAIIPYGTLGINFIKPTGSGFGRRLNSFDSDGKTNESLLGFQSELGLKIGYLFGKVFPFAYVAWNAQSGKVLFEEDKIKRNGIAFGLGVGFDF